MTHRTMYLLTPKGADVAEAVRDTGPARYVAAPELFDHQEDAERYATNRTPDGEPWRDHFDLYEVRPVGPEALPAWRRRLVDLTRERLTE